MLLEREAVLHDMGEHLTAALARQGRVVLVQGTAGAGKTSIIRRFVETARNRARVLLGACDPMSTPQPLGPLVDLATAIDEELDRTIVGAYSVREIFRRLLAELVSEATVFVLEDVHWADAATLDLLRYLARRVEDTSTVVVATYRDDELGHTHPLSVALGQLATYPWVHRYCVEPLSREAVALMAAERGVDADKLYRITGGNPFFVTELLNSGIHDIPAPVQHAVAGRMAGLSEAARSLTEVIAILGRPTSPQLLAALAPGASTALEEALCCGILFADGPKIEFRHELVRNAVLQTIPGYRRQDLHHRVLAALRSNPGGTHQLARLSHHADEAQDAAAVLDFAPAAAAEATALGAHREAAAQYTRALRYADDLPPERRATLLEGRAHSSYLANFVTEAIACWREAILLRRSQGDRLQEGDNLRWLSHMLWSAGRIAEASQSATAAIRVLQEGSRTRELAWAHVNMAMIASLDYDVTTAADYARRAIELGSQFNEPAIAIRARAHAAMAKALSRDQGWLDLEEAREQAVEAGLPEQAGFIGFLACWTAVVHRDLDRADRLLGRVLPYCLDQELPTFLSYARGASALAMLHRGQWSMAAAAATNNLADPGPLPINRLAPLGGWCFSRVAVPPGGAAPG